MKKKTTKKSYTIHLHYDMIHEMIVEANSPEKAIEIAYENFPDEDCSSDDYNGIIDACIVNEFSS